MRVFLKVKIKSLADETRTIRLEERKAKARRRAAAKQSSKDHFGDLFLGLRAHRILIVRSEARSAGLAYGFIRGRSYLSMEETRRTEPNWKRVEEIVAKFGDRRDDFKQALVDWRNVKPNHDGEGAVVPEQPAAAEQVAA